jgi:hypothetical protein
MPPRDCFGQLHAAGQREREVVLAAAGARAALVFETAACSCALGSSASVVRPFIHFSPLALQDLPGCAYLASSPSGTPYELQPTLTNVAHVIMLIMGFSSSSSSGSARPPSMSDLSHALFLSQGRTMQVVLFGFLRQHTAHCSTAGPAARHEAPLSSRRRQCHAGNRQVGGCDQLPSRMLLLCKFRKKQAEPTNDRYETVTTNDRYVRAHRLRQR